MSVQSEIDRIITAVGNAYSKVSEKGGTVPASQTVANLATAIDSIPAGGAPSLQSKSVTYTANGTATITPDEGYDALKKVDVTVDVASGGDGFNVSISIRRAFMGDTLVTGVMGEALPFKYAKGGPLSIQGKMSEGGAVYAGDIATGSQTYEYIVNLLNVDVYLYTTTKGWIKQEITSFPYRFPGEVLAAIYIPVANNAIINTTSYED